MNFLAHVYLSGDNDEIKVGNFIADWIKGSDFKKYSPGIQKGILLHRSIDSFTDNHPTCRKSKSRLAVNYGKYAGIIIDIFYDHFLANMWDSFSKVPLPQYAQNLYLLLGEKAHVFPADIREFIPAFSRRRWLESYATIEGIEKVLAGMSRQTSLPNQTTAAIQILRDSYADFTTEFLDYFPQLVAYVEEKFEVVVERVN
jgi:acyl carrier protein phosphodiesterase